MLSILSHTMYTKNATRYAPIIFFSFLSMGHIYTYFFLSGHPYLYALAHVWVLIIIIRYSCVQYYYILVYNVIVHCANIDKLTGNKCSVNASVPMPPHPLQVATNSTGTCRIEVLVIIIKIIMYNVHVGSIICIVCRCRLGYSHFCGVCPQAEGSVL